MIPPSVAIEIENGGDFATFLGEEYLFISSFGHISLNHSRETYFDILRSDFAGYELLSSSLQITDSMASLILFVSSMSDQSTRGRRLSSYLIIPLVVLLRIASSSLTARKR